MFTAISGWFLKGNSICVICIKLICILIKSLILYIFKNFFYRIYDVVMDIKCKYDQYGKCINSETYYYTNIIDVTFNNQFFCHASSGEPIVPIHPRPRLHNKLNTDV
jgi:hypothetical protein